MPASIFVHDLLLIVSLFFIASILKFITNKFSWSAPTAMIAGFLALVLSEQVFNIISFQGHFSFYIDIFLSVIFAIFPLSIKGLNLSFLKEVKTLAKYSALQYVLQWGLSLTVCIFILKIIWPFIGESFSVVLPGGFVGGYGSSAVVGGILSKLNYPDALSLSMSMATIGSFCAIVGGVLWIIWGEKQKLITNPNYKVDKKLFTFSQLKNYSPFPLFILIPVVTLSFLTEPVFSELIGIKLPIFAFAIIYSLVFRLLSQKKITLDQTSLSKYSNHATDLLVCIGIASIQISVVKKYLGPLISMAIIGIILCIIMFKYLGPKVFKDDWFEKTLFTWGWSVGGLIFGLALVKIITSKKDNTRLMQQFALVYLMLTPLEITLLLSMPYLIVAGYGKVIAILLILLAILIIKSLLKNTDK